jgi:hypothetical protein
MRTSAVAADVLFCRVGLEELVEMLYWLGVYALVVFVVSSPFLLLYVVMTAARLIIRTLKHAWALRPDFSGAHWSTIRR